MKWLQTLRGDTARDNDSPDAAPRPAADSLGDTVPTERGELMPETSSDTAASVLVEQSVPMVDAEPKSAAPDEAQAAAGRLSTGSAGPLDDLAVIKAAIDRAFHRFEQFAAGGDEIRKLLRAQLDRPQPATESEAPHPTPADAPRGLDDIAARQQELNRLFESRIRSDEVQAKTLERLHDELRQYKANFIRQEMLPLFKDVIFCHDFVAREIERLRAAPSTTSAAPPSAEPGGPSVKPLEILSQMLLDLLFKYDIEPYRCEGQLFDAKRQQCARTLPTEIADRDKIIAELGLSGFESPEGIIRREQVTVYKYKAN